MSEVLYSIDIMRLSDDEFKTLSTKVLNSGACFYDDSIETLTIDDITIHKTVPAAISLRLAQLRINASLNNIKKVVDDQIYMSEMLTMTDRGIGYALEDLKELRTVLESLPTDLSIDNEIDRIKVKMAELILIKE